MSNSVKYTEPGGRITVALDREGDDAVISVTDSGIGIPPESLAEIFEMFSQVHSDQARSGGGLGIGLALVQSLVHMHGGSVTAYSRGVGTGSTFTVRLPTVHLEAGHLPAVARAGGSDDAPGSAVSSETIRGPRWRILVADDNADAAGSLTLLLQLEGHEVRTATDGQQVVALAELFRPDLIFMDLGMPQLDGLEASRQIRARPWGKRVRIVALTGWGREEDRVRTMAAGIDLHWVKPVDAHALARILAAEPVRLKESPPDAG